MQSAASLEAATTATTSSSGEAVSILKLRCPVGKPALSSYKDPEAVRRFLFSTSSTTTTEAPSSRHADEECTETETKKGIVLATQDENAIRRELEQLGSNSQERILSLQSQLRTLGEWISSAFGVSDIQGWWEENQTSNRHRQDSEGMAGPKSTTISPVLESGFEMRRVEEKGGHAHGTSHGEGDAHAGTGKPMILAEENKPVLPLRIKLVDGSASSASPPGVTPSSVRVGTGSKNLSRMMNRPADGAATDTKTKAANQIAINVFWNYIEPFFKSIDENDLKVLDDTSRFLDPTPFSIPPLGKHYTEQWREQYGYQAAGGSGSSTNRIASRSQDSLPDQNQVEVRRTPTVVSLRERLLAMLIDENLTVPEAQDSSSANGEVVLNEGENSGAESGISSVMPETIKNVDFVHADERIRQELTDAGLCMFVPKMDYQEDDPICAEMRTLQRKLKEQVCINHYRKRKLTELVRSKLPAQEFYSLLSDLDKQIGQAYAKRSRIQKKRKKNSSAASSPSPAGLSSEPITLVETRQRLLEAFSGLIPKQIELLAPSKELLFQEGVEEKVSKYAQQTGSWLPIPEMPLQHVRLAPQAARPVFPPMDPGHSSPIQPDLAEPTPIFEQSFLR